MSEVGDQSKRIEVEVGLTTNSAENAQVIAGLAVSAPVVGAKAGKDFSTSLKKALDRGLNVKGAEGLFDDVVPEAKAAAAATAAVTIAYSKNSAAGRQAAQTARNIAIGQAAAGSAYGQTATALITFTNAQKQANNAQNAASTNAKQATQTSAQLAASLKALEIRTLAVRKGLASQGSDPDLFAKLDNELRELAVVQDKLRKGGNFSGDVLGLRALEAAAEGHTKVIGTELRGISRIIDETNARNTQAARQALAEKKTLYKQEETVLRGQQGLAVSLNQTTSAELVAAQKIAAQQQIQQAQASSRARIEIARFTFRQILFFERQIAKSIGGAVNIVGSITSGVASAVGRIGSLFQRSNRELNEGLNGALLQRERSMDRSFDRQTRNTATSLAQQSVLIEKFERQQAKGITGLTTGRSRLGSALGVAGGIGGSFLAADKLRAGFREAVNLNEEMNKTEQIFGSATQEIVAFSETSVDALFVTQSAALASAANFGIFAKSAGLAGSELAGFSTTLVTLATDLASFNNTSIAEASTAISAALRGESEPIRRYGVLLNEVVLQNRALEIGVIDTIRVLTPQERVLAANAEILAQTSDAQGDAARTRDDFANASRRATAASITFSKTLVQGFVPIAELLLKGVNPALEALTNFVIGNVSPAMKILRQGLIGAAAGITALLAARAAGEALQFLAIGLRAVLTPMGLVVVAFAAVGAAIAIIAQRSPTFANAMSRLGDVLADQVGPALDFVTESLQRFVTFLISAVLPIFLRVGTFIANTLVPVVVSLAKAITDRAVPAFERLKGAVVDAFETIRPFIQPLIDGFERLGEAIVAASQGDFSQIGSGLRAVVDGLGSTVSRIGAVLIDSLRGPLDRAVDFIKETFSAKNLESAFVGLFGIVERVGFILGSIVSDPRFLSAVALIGLAAVAIGGAFIKGFAEGVIDNLPGVMDLIGDVLSLAMGEVFKFILKEAFNPAFVLKALLAAFVLTSIVSTISRSMNAAGKKIGGNFATNLAAGVKEGFARNNFAAGFFGGIGNLERIATQEAQKATRAIARVQRRAASDLAAINVSPLQGPVRGGGSLGNADDPLATLRQLQGQFDKSAVAGAIMSARIKGAFSDVALAARGVGRAIKGDIGGGFAQAAAAGQSFGRNVGGIFRTAIANAKAAGVGIGQAAGGAILASTSAVLSGQAAGAASSTTGQALGFAGVISSALFGAAAVGGGPQGLAVGGFIAVLGTLGIALGESGRKAEAAAAQIDTYAGALRRAKTDGEALTGVAEGVTAALTQNEDVGSFLAASNFDSQAFADAVLNGATLVGALGDALGITDEQSQKFVDNLAQDGEAGFAILGQLSLAYGNVLAAQEKVANEDILNRGTVPAIEAANAATANWVDALSGIPGQAAIILDGTFQGAVAGINSVLSPLAQAILDAGGNLKDFPNLNETFIASKGGLDAFLESLGLAPDFIQKVTDELREGIPVMSSYAGEAARLGAIRITPEVDLDAIAAYEDKLADLNTRFLDTKKNSGLVEAALADLNRQRTEAIQKQINGVTTALSKASDAARKAEEDLTKFITGRYLDTPQAALDKLIGSIPGVGDALEEASLLGGEQGAAAVRQALGGLDAGLADFARSAFEAGLTPAETKAMLGPVFKAIDEEVNARGISIRTLDFTAGINPDTAGLIQEGLNILANENGFDIAVQTVLDRQAEERRLQGELDRLNLAAEAEVMFDANQVREALAAAGLDTEFLVDITPEAVAGAQQLSDAVNAVAEFEGAVLAILRENAENGPAPEGSTLQPVFNLYLNDELVGVLTSDAPSATIGTMRANANGNYVSPGGTQFN